MKQLNEYKWSLLAIAGILMGLLLSRGGLVALVPLVRMLMPVIIVVLAYKFVSKKIKGVASDFVTKNMGQSGGFGNVGSTQEQQVIDLCPKCGSYLKSGHKCS